MTAGCDTWELLAGGGKAGLVWWRGFWCSILVVVVRLLLGCVMFDCSQGGLSYFVRWDFWSGEECQYQTMTEPC